MTDGPTMQGMQPELVEEYAQLLATLASDIASKESELTTAVHSMQWQGEDADAARNRWVSSIKPAIAKAVQQLVSAHDAAMENAREQREVSAG